MTVQVKKAVVSLNRNIKRNTPRVIKKLSKAGVKADGNIIFSVAKYYDALGKLARK